jgi:hypothetical protein
MGGGIGVIPIDRFVSAIAELLLATAPGGFEITAKPVPLSEVDRPRPHDDSARPTVFTVNSPIY